MATCLQTITNAIGTGQVGTIPELSPNTLTPLAFGSANNELFIMKLPVFQAIQFQVQLVPQGSGSNISVTIEIYSLNADNTVTSQGSVGISDLGSGFSKDFNQGTYFLCIRTTAGSYTGTILASFRGYPTTSYFSFSAWDGAVLTYKFDDTRPPQPCDEPLFFEIVEGSLPPGIVMTALGKVQGILPNMDCVEENKDLSPSQNWYQQESDGSYTPWGRQWRFKVKVYLAEFPDSFDLDWFCIRIVNNWNFDRDNFLSQMPFTNVRQVEIIEQPQTIPTICFEPCDIVTPVDIIPVPLKEVCASCDSAEVETDVTLIQIPKQVANVSVADLPIWYVANQDKFFASEEVNKFIANLQDSYAFKLLLAQAGLIAPITSADDAARTAVNISEFNNFVQISVSSLVDGRNTTDLDTMMLQWRDEQNQKLPITLSAYEGETMMSLTLS
jgi:hypothetical protein